MKLGKLPPDMLSNLLGKISINDPRVLLGPGIGEDAALIDFGDKVLVAKTDPITFATDLVGWYAVQVNANDIACSGATPRWFLASVLLPASVSEEKISAIFSQITEACEELKVTLVGGHTEITQDIHQPIIAGCMLGEAETGKTISTSGAQIGDSIVATKGIAIEGTTLLAREYHSQLIDKGISESILQSAKNLLYAPGISVVRDASIACSNAPINSLHDPTEGGLATGLLEIASAARVGMHIDADAIPVLPECTNICEALSLDPLGLLASGCLIATLPKQNTDDLISVLEQEGIEAHAIGEVTRADSGIVMYNSNGSSSLPIYDRDEFARYIETQAY